MVGDDKDTEIAQEDFITLQIHINEIAWLL